MVPVRHLKIVAPPNIRSALETRALNCRATPNAFGVAKSRQAGGAPALQRLPQTVRKAKHEQCGENCEIGGEMRWEAPVLAGVAKTAAGDI